jgi:hypothetical protein
MGFFLFYVVFFFITNFLLYFHKIGFTYDSVITYYKGSEENFIPPKSYIGLLEITHAHLFAMGILLVTLTHLLLFVPGKDLNKVVLSIFVLVGGLCDIFAGWLVLYVHPVFAYFKILSFLVLQGGIGFLIVMIFLALISSRKLSYRDEDLEKKFQAKRSVSEIATKLNKNVAA